MRKRILCFLNVAVLVLILCSCANNEKTLLTEEFCVESVNTETESYTDYEKEEFLVGSINSNVYHYSDCRYIKRIKSYNKISFSSLEGAVSQGYRKCLVCSP